MSADAALSVVPRVGHVRQVRLVRPKEPAPSPLGLTLTPPIVFTFADAALSVVPRVGHVRQVRLVRPKEPAPSPLGLTLKTPHCLYVCGRRMVLSDGVTPYLSVSVRTERAEQKSAAGTAAIGAMIVR